MLEMHCDRCDCRRWFYLYVCQTCGWTDDADEPDEPDGYDGGQMAAETEALRHHQRTRQ
jgi:hypothetical protein